MFSGNDALLDDDDEEDSLQDVIRKMWEEFPKLCDSKNEEGDFDSSLHKARLEKFMERVARKCERRGFADGARLLRSNLYQDPRQKTREEDSRKKGGTSVYPGAPYR